MSVGRYAAMVVLGVAPTMAALLLALRGRLSSEDTVAALVGAVLAASNSVAAYWLTAGLVLDTPKHRWKTWVLTRWVPFDPVNTHTMLMHLALARTLDIAPCYEVVATWQQQDRDTIENELPIARGEPYAVLHTFPKFNYKMWQREAWISTAQWLQARGLHVVLTGGSEAAEIQYVDAIAREVPGAVVVAGRLTLSQTACLLARARAYVGPDTAITHMAAASGLPNHG